MPAVSHRRDKPGGSLHHREMRSSPLREQQILVTLARAFLKLRDGHRAKFPTPRGTMLQAL
jgi:hypothetical protein